MCKVFYYKNVEFSPQTGILTCSYACGEHTFTETIQFPHAPFSLNPVQEQALISVCRLAHIALGISYYKAFLPHKIVIEGTGLTSQEARFFERFYLSGLGEFAIRNHVNLQGKIKFPVQKKETKSYQIPLKTQALIPVGGGKDSCLTIELVKQLDIPCITIAIGNPRPIQECMDTAHIPSLNLVRKIDPALIRLNQTGTVYNGHVPITGILAFLLWIAAILYQKKFVVMSCERSANSGNMTQGDLTINHQYSKSFEFEQDFHQITQSVTPDFHYFSLLRPLSEAHIAKLFAQNCSDYFPVFTSCNKAFKLDESKRLDRWCGACDKCRFVFLILAPFIPKEKLIKIVGQNPLNDSTQIAGYQELLGLCGHKPFECVGEFQESRWAFSQLLHHPDWQQDAVIQHLAPQVENASDSLIFTPASTHLIPKEFYHVLDKFKS